MSYHPIIGITIFLVFLILAFLLGKRVNLKISKNNILKIKDKKNIKTDSISPDANWID